MRVGGWGLEVGVWGSEEGSYLRRIDFFVSLNSRLASNKEEEEFGVWGLQKHDDGSPGEREVNEIVRVPSLLLSYMYFRCHTFIFEH